VKVTEVKGSEQLDPPSKPNQNKPLASYRRGYPFKSGADPQTWLWLMEVEDVGPPRKAADLSDDELAAIAARAELTVV
jgi:hypothetical protein